MSYEPLFKHPGYYVFKDTGSGKLYCTVIVGDVAVAIETFEMSSEEIQSFQKLKGTFLEAIRMNIERDRNAFTSRFIKGFDGDPDVAAVIRECSFKPIQREKSWLKRLFSKS